MTHERSLFSINRFRIGVIAGHPDRNATLEREAGDKEHHGTDPNPPARHASRPGRRRAGVPHSTRATCRAGGPDPRSSRALQPAGVSSGSNASAAAKRHRRQLVETAAGLRSIRSDQCLAPRAGNADFQRLYSRGQRSAPCPALKQDRFRPFNLSFPVFPFLFFPHFLHSFAPSTNRSNRGSNSS